MNVIEKLGRFMPIAGLQIKAWALARVLLCLLCVSAWADRSLGQELDPEQVGEQAALGDAADSEEVFDQWRELLIEIDTTGGRAERMQLYAELGRVGDGRLVPALEAYRSGLLAERDGQLVIYESRVQVDERGEVYPLVDAFTAEPVVDDSGERVYAEGLVDMLRAARPDRRPIGELMSTLSLLHPDPERRRRAIIRAGDRADADVLPAMKAQLEAESSRRFARYLREAIARIELATSDDREERLAAVATLEQIGGARGGRTLRDALEQAQAGDDEALAAAVASAIARVDSRQTRLRWLEHTFAGLSVASVLILMALGLAVIFGLMGVINMAHGEFMMIGAFTTMIVASLFQAHLPAAMFDWYLLAAVPAAFLVAALIGLVCEKLVIRHLYGRPLETLLATWGIGLILMQSARVIFGDVNRITSPAWMRGSVEIVHDLSLPMYRLFALGFCIACVAMAWALIHKTRGGLLLRATVQDRMMASSLGVSTRRVDGLTFAFGTGLAGLAGCAVVFFDNLTPGMGQRYIVDSFMVVVAGGVGNIFGAVAAGLGLGLINQYLEPFTSPTYAKVIVLLLLVVFLQWRPSGIFPARGRLADA